MAHAQDSADPDALDDSDLEVMRLAAAWAALPEAEALCARAARAALAGVGMHQPLAVVLADDATITPMNTQFRAKPGPTNVLAFPAPPAVGLLGDVILAFETIEREAASQGKTLADHTTHLVVHGVLHLLGYDHQTDADAERMEARERVILAGLGVADPYAGEDTD